MTCFTIWFSWHKSDYWNCRLFINKQANCIKKEQNVLNFFRISEKSFWHICLLKIIFNGHLVWSFGWNSFALIKNAIFLLTRKLLLVLYSLHFMVSLCERPHSVLRIQKSLNKWSNLFPVSFKFISLPSKGQFFHAVMEMVNYYPFLRYIKPSIYSQFLGWPFILFM